MDVINEKSSWFVTCAFADEEGAAVTPSSGSYRIDNLEADGSYAEVRAETPFAPSGPEHEIEITAAENAMLDQGRASETRVLTVTFSYGADRQGTAEYRYIVRNLGSIS